MTDAEDSLKSNIIFRGIDGNECESFVVAIRDLAFANGKEEDCHWMLHYATTRLRGKALRWHAKLDPSIRKDWDLFVQAMFEEFPPVEERDDDGTTGQVRVTHRTSNIFDPTISSVVPPRSAELGSAPLDSLPVLPRVYDPSAPGLQVGRLRIVYEEGETGPHYVQCGSGLKGITWNINEALIVSFVASSEPHQIGCMNSRQDPNLSVKIYVQAQSDFHPLIGAAEPGTPFTEDKSSTWSTYFTQTASSIWTILSDGTLRATLPELLFRSEPRRMLIPSESYSTATVYVEIPGNTISFVKDHNTPRALHPISKRPVVRARIVFEPM